MLPYLIELAAEPACGWPDMWVFHRGMCLVDLVIDADSRLSRVVERQETLFHVATPAPWITDAFVSTTIALMYKAVGNTAGVPRSCLCRFWTVVGWLSLVALSRACNK